MGVPSPKGDGLSAAFQRMLADLGPQGLSLPRCIAEDECRSRPGARQRVGGGEISTVWPVLELFAGAQRPESPGDRKGHGVLQGLE